MKRSILVPLAFTLAAGCNRGTQVTAAECATLLDHFFDLKINEAPETAKMTPEQKEAFRTGLKQTAASDPDVKQVTEQCQSEVTRGELDCGMHATTSRAWNDCIQ
jgi:hypothetical protein